MENATIIGGADGPTSVFVREKNRKKTFREKINDYFLNKKRKRISSSITVNPHTLEEVIAYAKAKYAAMETEQDSDKYQENFLSAKEWMMRTHAPELLCDCPNVSVPATFSEEAVREFVNQTEAVRNYVKQIPEETFQMDFHIYEIRNNDAVCDIVADFRWDFFSVSYAGEKKDIKGFDRINKELHTFYGVTETDIVNRTKRYSKLLEVLCR